MTEKEQIAALMQLGRAAWPALAVDAAAFEEQIERLASRGDSPLVEHAADLYLACACASGVPGAVEAFEKAFAEQMSQAIDRVDRSPDFKEEVLQLLRIKLFVKDPPKIRDYGGRAKLRTWLATAAGRTALDLRKSSGSPPRELPNVEAAAASSDVYTKYVRERYRGDFQDAVRASVLRLTSRDRALLRLHFGERVALERLAVVYGVSRATIARWIAAARDSLLEEARREVRERLGVSESELIEVGADMRSVIDVSLVRLLASSEG